MGRVRFEEFFRIAPPMGRGNTDDYLCGLDNPEPCLLLDKLGPLCYNDREYKRGRDHLAKLP